MDVYITEKESGTRYALAMLPEQVKHTGGANFRTYDIISVGEAKTPNGTRLLQFSWSGMFPGGNRTDDSFIKAQHWQPPAEMQSAFERWRENGTVLNLMVTETWINHEVLVSEFSAAHTGGYGDVEYDVTFVQNREIRIYTTSELNLWLTAKTNDTAATAARPEPAEAAAKTYTVKSGDTLWTIARKYLGKSSRYAEIYELNAAGIEAAAKKHGRNSSERGHWIYPGLTLSLPA